MQLTKGSQLKKGTSVKLSKGLRKLRLSLNWEFKEGQDADLDASAISLGKDGKMLGEGTAVWYGCKVFCREAIKHSGDVRTSGDTDDGKGNENIDLDLSKICDHVSEILAVIASYSEEQPVLFGRVKNAGVTLYKLNDEGTEPVEGLFNCDLSEDMSNYTSMEVARIYRNEGGEWSFQPMSAGLGLSPQGMKDVFQKYNPWFEDGEDD